MSRFKLMSRCPDRFAFGIAKQALLFLLTMSFALGQSVSENDPDLTLNEFRALLPTQAREQNPEAADAMFFDLLATQGRVAAARQSVDRLTGWTRAAETRLAAQSAPLLEVEMLRFAESRAEVRLERLESDLRRLVAAANGLLGRAPDTVLMALTTNGDNGRSTGSPKQSDMAVQISRFEQQLLPAAHELLNKMYQNYLFGGISLSALLWQEEQVYETELQYRALLTEAERQRYADD
jgi:outer membrane protein TolC